MWRLWNSEFFWMKGLLITPAAAAADGPQITQAAAGDQVRLQARLYNYSLADMPPDSNVNVQFYAQPWNTSNNTPSGNSFLIENVVIGPIPGFNSQSNDGMLANWAVAETTKLDTAAHSNQHLVFWVLVVQAGQGNPIAECRDWSDKRHSADAPQHRQHRAVDRTMQTSHVQEPVYSRAEEQQARRPFGRLTQRGERRWKRALLNER